MSTILDKANQIKLEKDTKIIPGNIKAGVQIFDVVGTHQGGIEDITNGKLIHCKAANNTVPANTFVNLLKSIPLSTQTDATYQYLTTTMVSTNKLFVTYGYNNRLYGRLDTINGDTVVLGAPVQLIATNNSHLEAKAVLIDTNKVFIVHAIRSGSSSYLYGCVCTINGDTITVGTDTKLNENSGYDKKISICTLDTNKVFITHGGNNYLHGMICTVSGTDITVATDEQLVSTSVNSSEADICLIDTDTVCIIHGVDSSSKINALVCTISSTTITSGTNTQISSVSYSSANSHIIKVDTNKVFITFKETDSTTSQPVLKAVACVINSTTITPGTAISLGSQYEVMTSFGGVFLEPGKILIFYKNDNYETACQIVTFNNTNIILNEYDLLQSSVNTVHITQAVQITENKVLIIYGGYSYTESGQNYLADANIANLSLTDNEVSIVTNVTASGMDESRGSWIEGIATTECTTTTAGDVYILNL